MVRRERVHQADQGTRCRQPHQVIRHVDQTGLVLTAPSFGGEPGLNSDQLRTTPTEEFLRSYHGAQFLIVRLPETGVQPIPAIRNAYPARVELTRSRPSHEDSVEHCKNIIGRTRRPEEAAERS